jgi:hypothetical protein
MKLSDFQYPMAKELVKYSLGVPGTIASFNNDYSSKIGTISQVPCCGQSPKEDRMEYWDSSKDTTYGRYLLFKNTKWEIIPFWTGFSASKKKTFYCIWFKEDDISKYIGKLKNKKIPNVKFGNKEVWIQMSGIDITDATVKDLWHKVFEVLK